MSGELAQLISQLQHNAPVKVTAQPLPLPSRPFLVQHKPKEIAFVVKPLKEQAIEVSIDVLSTVHQLKNQIGNGKLLKKGKGLHDCQCLWNVLQPGDTLNFSRQKETVEEEIAVEVISESVQELPRKKELDDIFVSKLKSLLDTKLDQDKSVQVLEQCLDLIKKHL
jgi:hypothetical protein